MRYVTSIERMGIKLGLEQGLQKGRQEGRLEGRLEGQQEGKQEGLREGIKRAVLNLRAELDLTAERIAEVMKLPLETVQQYLDANEQQTVK